MADDEKVEVLAHTEIEKLTRLTKYYRLQNMILGTNMTLRNICKLICHALINDKFYETCAISGNISKYKITIVLST